jgi:hypothetical protein
MLADATVGAGDIIGLLLGNGGLLIALIVAIVSVVRGDWVPRTSHEAIVKSITDGKDAVIALQQEQLEWSERRGDEWKRIADRNSALASTAVVTAKEVAHQ